MSGNTGESIYGLGLRTSGEYNGTGSSRGGTFWYVMKMPGGMAARFRDQLSSMGQLMTGIELDLKSDNPGSVNHLMVRKESLKRLLGDLRKTGIPVEVHCLPRRHYTWRGAADIRDFVNSDPELSLVDEVSPGDPLYSELTSLEFLFPNHSLPREYEQVIEDRAENQGV